MINVSVIGCTNSVFKDIASILTVDSAGVIVTIGKMSNFIDSELIRTEFNELVLLDLESIGISSLLNLLKHRNQNVKTPIVMLVDVDSDPQLLVSALDAGVADYVFKPIKPADLVQTVGQFSQEVGSDNRTGHHSINARRVFDCG